ncbi:MAG TPA: hypothetical protein QKA14_01915 [Candidatus Megaira endosymbiont of Hartmannula sinica]|nr:hypothetical protein [Candidatus Megaera endosymbiont of Hartmannula sinica]
MEVGGKLNHDKSKIEPTLGGLISIVEEKYCDNDICVSYIKDIFYRCGDLSGDDYNDITLDLHIVI